MPNIKLYGFNTAEAETLKRKIHELFAGKSWQNDYVVTRILSEVTDHDGANRPFIELRNYHDDNTPAIIRLLLTLGYDLEAPDNFYPVLKEGVTVNLTIAGEIKTCIVHRFRGEQLIVVTKDDVFRNHYHVVDLCNLLTHEGRYYTAKSEFVSVDQPPE